MTRKVERGMTLIEVLVALVVMSLGVFTAAALQGRALSTTDSALRSTQVLLLAQEVLERVRAAGRLGAGEGAQLQRDLQAVVGASAQARVTQAGADIALDLGWPEGAFVIRGRVMP
ncbi:type IV pilus modification protein PilV [Pseudomonas sp. MAFF212428]|uniref:Type IV pilus modification protein PilV n=1 Tax=Pseudomonas brassicae TaxID=2708063 RepID=A0A6B3NUG1_9PSED|nr:type IV pilus modification protein PilV [Pseudomonas brassicae]NER61464.1 type IV pilus modification protein PilV [Pseudomonas brassicae]NER62984.1 type IV pilus modification protein PilV [Pseudomonas brassicae]